MRRFLTNLTLTCPLPSLLVRRNDRRQVFILDSLSKYTPSDGREAEGIIERVTPRLQHANSAVVMSAVKVVLNYMNLVQSEDSIKALTRKLAPPLVTLLNSEPETQFVALRNINLIVQKRPGILENEIKVFFAKYNVPIYVKMEKLEIIIKLSSERNVEQVLLELKEYATEVDVDFVRKSVTAIGRCAIKLPRAAERCISVLLELIQSKVNYVVQEAVVVIKDIFRRYPNKYESVIAQLCENLETLDEPEAKGSMIWIIGEYAERIDNADELLETFLETFEEVSSTSESSYLVVFSLHPTGVVCGAAAWGLLFFIFYFFTGICPSADINVRGSRAHQPIALPALSQEDPSVQLALLTATVKCFLKAPEDTQEMVQKVLDMATEESDNPDLRDRGFVYWRLLSTDPEAAKAVVLSEKPVIEDDTSKLEPELLDTLIGQIATLSSIYHKPPEVFVTRANIRSAPESAEDDYDYEDENDVGASGGGDAPGGPVDLLDIGGVDLNGGGPSKDQGLASQPSQANGTNGAIDLFGAEPTSVAPACVKVQVCDGSQSNGIIVKVGFTSSGGAPSMEMEFQNGGTAPIGQLAIQFNKNAFGMAPSNQQLTFNPPIMPGSTGPYSIPLNITPSMLAPVQQGSQAPQVVQAAIKNMSNNSVFYFSANFTLEAIFSKDGGMERSDFINTWKGISDQNELYGNVKLPSDNIDATVSRLSANNVFFIARRKVPNVEGQEVVYVSCKTLMNHRFLAELTFKAGFNGCKICVKSQNSSYSNLAKEAIERCLV